MPNFKATIRFVDLVGPDILTVRRALEDRLRTSGIGKWRVVDVSPEKAGVRSRFRGARLRADRDFAAKLMLMGAVIWALWFFWVLVE